MEGTMNDKESIEQLALVGISIVEVVSGIFDAVAGLAEILFETIAVADLPESFIKEKTKAITELIAEAGRVFSTAELVIPR